MESYDQRRYQETIEILSQCSPQRMLERGQKISAYEMLALSYFAVNHHDSARVAADHLLSIDSTYTPQPPRYKPGYIAMTEKIKEEHRKRENRSLLRNKWFWLSSLTASSVAAYLIITKDDGPGLLPEAPDPPGVAGAAIMRMNQNYSPMDE